MVVAQGPPARCGSRTVGVDHGVVIETVERCEYMSEGQHGRIITNRESAWLGQCFVMTPEPHDLIGVRLGTVGREQDGLSHSSCGR